MKAKRKEGSDGRENSSRTSFQLQDLTLRKLNYIALVERVSRNQLIEENLQKMIGEWERQNGNIRIHTDTTGAK